MGCRESGRAAALRLRWLKGIRGRRGRGQNLGACTGPQSPVILGSHRPSELSFLFTEVIGAKHHSECPSGRTEETRLSHYPRPRAGEAPSDPQSGATVPWKVTEPPPLQAPGSWGEEVRGEAEGCLLFQKGRCAHQSLRVITKESPLERIIGRIHRAHPRPIQGPEPVSKSVPPLEERGVGLPPLNKASFMPPPPEPGLWIGHVPSWWGTSGHTYSTPLVCTTGPLSAFWAALF